MIKRKWYERVPAAALAAMLMVNSGGANLQVKAEVVSVSEEDSTDAKKADRGETEEKESQDRDNKSKDYGEDGDVNKKRWRKRRRREKDRRSREKSRELGRIGRKRWTNFGFRRFERERNVRKRGRAEERQV